MGRVIAGFPRPGIEHIIAQVFEGAAVEAVASTLGFDFDGA